MNQRCLKHTKQESFQSFVIWSQLYFFPLKECLTNVFLILDLNSEEFLHSNRALLFFKRNYLFSAILPRRISDNFSRELKQRGRQQERPKRNRFRCRLHGSGQFFNDKKTCTDPPFVHTGPAEPIFLKWKKY